MDEILTGELNDIVTGSENEREEQDTISADISHYESTIDTFLEDIREETESNESESSGEKSESEDEDTSSDESSDSSSNVGLLETDFSHVEKNDTNPLNQHDNLDDRDTYVGGDAGLNLNQVPKKKEARIDISVFKKFDKKDLEERFPSYISLLGPESFLKTTQEPWPDDVKLFQPYEVEQILLPDNANCLAVQAFLQMCQLKYQVEPRRNAEAMSPTGKVPFIKCGAFVVSELEGIVQFVNNRGISLTNELDNEAKSDMRAYMCLVHNVLEKAELYICWMDDETYNDVTSVRHGSVFPWPLNHIENWTKRRAVMKNLKVWNWYHKTLEEVFQEVENACQALSDRLDDKEYFFGTRTELDGLVFGHLYSLCTTPLHSDQFQNIFKKFRSLVEHSKRICELMDGDTFIFDEMLTN